MNKKFIIILIIVIVSTVLIGTCSGILFGSLNNKKETTSKTEIELDNGNKVNIVLNDSMKVEYEKYDNGLVSFKYPKGWTVEVAPADYIHYNFKIEYLTLKIED